MDFENLHQILRSLYDEMMPLCEDMAGVAKGIAGLGALFYVAYRVWQSLARAEPIDVFPMLRPFAIGLCIMFFPTVVLGTLSGVLSPVVQGTAQMLEAETLDMNQYREQKDKLEYEAMKRKRLFCPQGRELEPTLELSDIILTLADDLCTSCIISEYGLIDTPEKRQWYERYCEMTYRPR